jgi:alanine racemase
MGTINYEVVCLIGKRVPRVYRYQNEIVKITNLLS